MPRAGNPVPPVSRSARGCQTAEAEKVFRQNLLRNPRNGRSLFGLWESLKAQKRDAEAFWVQQEFEAAWKLADGPLRLADL